MPGLESGNVALQCWCNVLGWQRGREAGYVQGHHHMGTGGASQDSIEASQVHDAWKPYSIALDPAPLASPPDASGYFRLSAAHLLADQLPVCEEEQLFHFPCMHI